MTPKAIPKVITGNGAVALLFPTGRHWRAVPRANDHPEVLRDALSPYE